MPGFITNMCFVCLLALVIPLLGAIERYSASECCHHINATASTADDTSLMACVNGSLSFIQDIPPSSSSSSSSSSQESSMIWSLFASPQVYSYAAHTTLVNALYFEYHNFTARMLSESTGDDWYPKDRRWNKIRSVVKALDPLEGWARGVDVMIFIDTDLLILDWQGLQVQSLLDEHPRAHILMSRDALDVANTGFMIIRNTPWALEFFQAWWDGRDMPFTFCDQHVLNKLVANLNKKKRAKNKNNDINDDGLHSEGEEEAVVIDGTGSSKIGSDSNETVDEEKVAILSPTAINSRWPAIETFSSTDKVLHLMGESNPYRSTVAKYASTSVCEVVKTLTSDTDVNNKNDGKDDRSQQHIAHTIYQHLPPQLDFSQHRLKSLARLSLQQERRFRLSTILSSIHQDHYQHITPAHFHSLHTANTACCDDKRRYLSSEPSVCEGYFMQEYELAEELFTKLMENGPDDTTGNADSISNEPIRDLKLFLLDHAAKVLYDTLYFVPRHRKIHTAAQLIEKLESLHKYVDMDNVLNKRYVNHKKALIYAQLTAYYMSVSAWNDAIHSAVQAVDNLGTVLQFTQTSEPDFAGFVLEYVDSASNVAQIFHQLQQYEQALEWSSTALKNAQVLFQSYHGEERLMAIDISKLHLLVAEHHIALHQYTEARQEMELASMIIVTYDVDPASREMIQRNIERVNTILKASMNR